MYHVRAYFYSTRSPTYPPTLSQALADNAAQIEKELIECQGPAVDLGGYWQPDPAKVDQP